MSDKSLGSIIFIIGLIGAILYTGWLFWPATAGDILFYVPGIDGVRWALVLPIFIAVLAVLVIGMWIGWTMAVTPPPMMIEEEIGKTDETKEEDTEGN